MNENPEHREADQEHPKRRETDKTKWWRSDALKFVMWAAGLIFAAGILYARVETMEKTVNHQDRVLDGMVEALQQMRISVEKMNREIDLRVEMAEKEHAHIILRLEKEVERLEREMEFLRDRRSGEGGQR